MAVIDTGAERSIGNRALLDALADRGALMERRGMIRISGIVGPDTLTTAIVVSSMHMGPYRIQHLPVLFGDPSIFATWGLQQRPAILIGKDVLGRYEALGIDYTRGVVLFKNPV